MASPAVFGEGVWGDFVWGDAGEPVTSVSSGGKFKSGPYPVDAVHDRPKPEYVKPPTRAEGLRMIQQLKNVHMRGGTAPKRPRQSPLSLIQRQPHSAAPF